MRIRYLTSFTRTFEYLSQQEQTKTADTISELVNFLDKKTHPSKGLGVKKLRKNLYEVRVNIKTRILFKILPDLIAFVIIGSHDEIKRYLNNL
ncbi:MAG: hypothetical protein AUJ85_00630 [Elusimicrobia bacterium CG1_02_37_114]|nr:MAG: hypothetical protein AUJ85_00630 [Elusimicrobia bacterium CG1_02_37_114]PIV52988.1 MAG: hypothetical protein COS17_06205 [Elusimicrobia bacterium CG02_land_8_20_14_3_00_37_13]PIZ14325.1 MAG: hypothetical protein COY53_00430 [Elusimicrobia bacterium CG_4_10_14_0_8_um_filter_37_32]